MMPVVVPLSEDEGALEAAGRQLALVDRAESPAERASLLASAEALVIYARGQLRELDSKLSAYKAETPPTDRE